MQILCINEIFIIPEYICNLWIFSHFQNYEILDKSLKMEEFNTSVYIFPLFLSSV